jgi:hypothetical protein
MASDTFAILQFGVLFLRLRTTIIVCSGWPVKTETVPFSARKTSERGEELKLVALAGDIETVACARNKKTSAARLPNLT